MIQTTTEPVTDTTDRELVITRVFDAPRALVFACWTQNEHCRAWLAPSDCTLIDCDGDPRPGGAWHEKMRVPSGDIHKAFGVYKEVVQDERLVFTHAWEGDDGQPEHWTLVTVEFTDQPGSKTLMTFKQSVFRSVESRDGHRGGWGQCFDELAAHLATLAP